MDFSNDQEDQDRPKDPVKEAFYKVKKDMAFLSSQILGIKDDLSQMKKEMLGICDILERLSKELKESIENKEKQEKHEKVVPTDQQITPTNTYENQTLPPYTPTHNYPLNPLKAQNQGFSTGNEGVPTDRQTDKQTVNTSQKQAKTQVFLPREIYPSPIEDAAKILDSLDTLKKEIRLKFKNLTEQELLIFSTLYQLEEEQGPVDYRTLAQKLGLTESSIRDYIGRLLKKGIPVDKTKINNKQIQLSVSQNLKKIASLATILQLRDI